MEHEEEEEKKQFFFYGFLGKQMENENGAEKKRFVCLTLKVVFGSDLRKSEQKAQVKVTTYLYNNCI